MQKAICRVCLNDSPGLVSLFGPYRNHSASYFINLIADVKILVGDTLPQTICDQCLNELEIIIKFKEKCENSDLYLHRINESTTNKCESIVKTEDIQAVKEEHLEIEYNSAPESPDVFLSTLSPLRAEKHIRRRKLKKRKEGQSISGLVCKECGKTFKSECKLKVHWKSVHKISSYTCNKCKRIFKALVTYEKHINQDVSCDVRFKGVRIEGSGRSRMYYCNSCEYKSNSMMNMKAHTVRHSGARPHACQLCPKTYTSLKSLLYHKETVHNIFKIEITCHLCGKVVEGRHRFNRHLRFSHPKTLFQCDICKAFKKSKWALINHLRIHENLKQFICDICGRSFNISSNLRNHVRRAHESHTFDCNMCAYKSKKGEYLKKHIEQHYQEKHQCSICWRFLDNLMKLNKHIEVHGEKKYFCFYCNKGFVRKSNCNEHEKTKHGRRIQTVFEGGTEKSEIGKII